MHKEISDLEFAFNLAVLADTATLNSGGITVTAADGDAEDAILKALTATQPDDGFLGEETSSRPSRNGTLDCCLTNFNDVGLTVKDQ